MSENDAERKIYSKEGETHNVGKQDIASGNSASFKKLHQVINEGSNGKTLDNSEHDEVFVHKDILEFGVYDAVSHFNIGCNAIIELFKSMNIPAGKYTELASQTEDKFRISLAQYKSTPKAKKRRMVIRGLKKKKKDKNQQA